jgi:hypothetical protein
MPFPRLDSRCVPPPRPTRQRTRWQDWILAATGDGEEWARVFHTGPQDSERIWAAIAAAVLHAPVSVIRNRAPHGVVCEVDVTLAIQRTASVATNGRGA